MTAPYQLLPPLTPEEYAALRADIAAHGVTYPIVSDEAGNVLDGHHRQRIAAELGIDCPTVVLAGLSADEKAERALALNLKRRHLGPIAWADAFRRLAELRGVRLGSGRGDPSGKAATVAALASEAGVPARTARYRLALADNARTYAPDLVAAIDRGEAAPGAVNDRMHPEAL